MERRIFANYPLEPPIIKAAAAIYPRLQAAIGPSKGFNVPNMAIGPISALIACEEQNSSRFSIRSAQAMACLSPADFAKALKTARAALDHHDTLQAERKTRTATTTTTPTLTRSSSSRQLKSQASQSSLSSSPSKDGTRTWTFQKLCAQKGFDWHTIGPSLERVYDYLSQQGWGKAHWDAYSNTIKIAVFYWTAVAQERPMKSLESVSEEFGADASMRRRIKEVLTSMEAIRESLLGLVGHQLGSEEPVVEPASPTKRKAAAAVLTPKKDRTRERDRESPPTKRVRMTSSPESESESQPPYPSIPKISNPDEDEDEAPPASSVRFEEDTGDNLHLHHQTPTKRRFEDTKGGSSSSTSLFPTQTPTKRPSSFKPDRPIPKANQPRQRHRPVFPDRAFYELDALEVKKMDQEAAWLAAWVSRVSAK